MNTLVYTNARIFDGILRHFAIHRFACRDFVKHCGQIVCILCETVLAGGMGRFFVRMLFGWRSL
jgi:hypothetical protein